MCRQLAYTAPLAAGLVTLAWIRQAGGDRAGASDAIGEAGRIGSVIQAGALRTLALAASGQQADAVTALAGVLTLAGPRGYVRVFADEGPPMAALVVS